MLATFAREGEANEAAAITGHEVNGFSRDVIGSNEQIAFVFTVFVIDHDDNATRAQVCDDVFYGGNLYRRQGTARIRRHVTSFKRGHGQKKPMLQSWPMHRC